MTPDAKRAYDRAYYAAHREERHAYQVAYRASHRAERAAATRAWRAANPEKEAANRAAHGSDYLAKYRRTHAEELRARSRAYNASHRETRRAHRQALRVEMAPYFAEYRRTHPEQARVAGKRWEASHPDAVREKRRKHSAVRRGAQSCDHPGCLAIGASVLAWQTNDHVCWLCGTPVWQGVNLHMDHVLPISKGGLHCADNLRPACAPCNQRKSSKVAA
jgi:5-methylcytosine-specific restriction endonuclease McrA